MSACIRHVGVGWHCASPPPSHFPKVVIRAQFKWRFHQCVAKKRVHKFLIQLNSIMENVVKISITSCTELPTGFLFPFSIIYYSILVKKWMITLLRGLVYELQSELTPKQKQEIQPSELESARKYVPTAHTLHWTPTTLAYQKINKQLKG